MHAVYWLAMRSLSLVSPVSIIKLQGRSHELNWVYINHRQIYHLHVPGTGPEDILNFTVPNLSFCRIWDLIRGELCHPHRHCGTIGPQPNSIRDLCEQQVLSLLYIVHFNAVLCLC